VKADDSFERHLGATDPDDFPDRGTQKGMNITEGDGPEYSVEYQEEEGEDDTGDA
jgi:hypothetical protein